MKMIDAKLLGLLLMLNCCGVAMADSEELLSVESRDKIDFAVKALKDNYYTKVEENTIVENMLSGMLNKMDPHSCYLAKDEMHDFESETTGQFGGIGVEIMPDKGFILIVTPIDDTPAARAGIKAGDKIIQINDTLTHDLSSKKAVELMRGEPGTKVKLVISPKDGSGPVVKELTREMINVKSVRYRMLEPGYGYIRVTFFQANTGKELREAVAALIKQAAQANSSKVSANTNSDSLISKLSNKWQQLIRSGSQASLRNTKVSSENKNSKDTDKETSDRLTANKKGTKTGLCGLILDLRNNPGGLLDSGIQVADTFLDASKMGDNKRIVYTESRTSNSKFIVHATVGDLLDGKPLVVLINEGSASAAEIVAGALQDHHRAVVVGKRSFGKGSVQSLIPLSDGSGIKITTAVYYTPGGVSLQAQGVMPDVEAEDITINPKAVNKNTVRISESSLADHIEVNQKTEDAQRKSLREPEPTGDELLYKDYPLYEALQVLKAGDAFSSPKTPLTLPTEVTNTNNQTASSNNDVESSNVKQELKQGMNQDVQQLPKDDKNVKHDTVAPNSNTQNKSQTNSGVDNSSARTVLPLEYLKGNTEFESYDVLRTYEHISPLEGLDGVGLDAFSNSQHD